jgi:MSHA pilin protein MshD
MFTPDRVAVSARSAQATSVHRTARQRGISLLELIMFIIIVSIGVTALLLVFNTTLAKSVDPMIQKQMLAIAESLLEEVEAKPFTYCDPDDANAASAANAAGCATTAEAMGPEAGPETRTSTTIPFDNVNDYGAGLIINPITDLTGTAIAGLGAYSATIAVAAVALGTVPATDSLQITVTVTGPGNNSLVLQGYRTRYAPNAI